MNSGFATVHVQNAFCQKCSSTIKKELLKIMDITNVYLYPTDSLVVFNFVKANELSTALNILTDLGYPPEGERINSKKPSITACNC
ncbi:copper chaperone CopZ [Saonia flava]|uniref:Copper chaperone CopZ n=1 Tax=Saonia flava TaxID=523696 RepID=A0A846QYE1_9FLAO|nr:heavy-metal-associated domain-containing protein [Saonia flava]NJB70144.1 copper chaperone CopZ [Saonia flava]